MDHLSLEQSITTTEYRLWCKFCSSSFTNSCSLGKLSISNPVTRHVFKSPFYCLHIRSAALGNNYPVVRSPTLSLHLPQASPTLRDHTGICKHTPEPPFMNVDVIRPAPLLLQAHFTGMANIQFCQSRYSLSFLICLCWY